MIEEVKQKISEGAIEEALTMLREETVSDAKVNNQVIALLARYNYWKDKNILGTNENDIELRSVVESAMEIINRLEKKEALAKKYPKWFVDSSSIKIQIQISISMSAGFVLAFLAAGLAYVFKDGVIGQTPKNPDPDINYIDFYTLIRIFSMFSIFIFLFLNIYYNEFSLKMRRIFYVVLFTSITIILATDYMSLFEISMVYLSLFLIILFVIWVIRLCVFTYFHLIFLIFALTSKSKNRPS